MEANEIEKKIKALPDDLKKEVIDYIDFLIMKKKKSNKQTGGFNFSWEGGLAELRDQYTSVTLQHKATEWR